MAEQQRALGADGVVTLKELALLGGLDSREKLSCSGLAERLDVSTQTASRRLQQLEEGEYIEREIVSDGQWVGLTERGAQRLQAEYADYRQVFERDASVTLTGTVTSGMGEGRHYISLEGYMRQFREKLGYEPFAGTLNVDLEPDSVRMRARLSSFDPITIEGWENDDRTYGPAYCYPASITVDGEGYDRLHVIAPERTHHGDDHLELIAPAKLRAELDLEDGDEVRIDVEG
jgi:riboflavin kinase